MSIELEGWDFDESLAERIVGITSRVESADFRRVDPPAELWEQIAASVASEPEAGPRNPPGRNDPVSNVVEYRIDAYDRVVDVGESWADFASDNDGLDLAKNPPDQTLWTYFDREETRDIWRLLVAHVRKSQKAAQVPLRCDAPGTRRWTEMTLTPESDGGVHFRSVVVFEESRPTVPLLDLHEDRDEGSEPVLVCSWCGLGQHGSGWCEIEELVRDTRLLERESLPPVSFGICASCQDVMSAEMVGSDAIAR